MPGGIFTLGVILFHVIDVEGVARLRGEIAVLQFSPRLYQFGRISFIAKAAIWAIFYINLYLV